MIRKIVANIAAARRQSATQRAARHNVWHLVRLAGWGMMLSSTAGSTGNTNASPSGNSGAPISPRRSAPLETTALAGLSYLLGSIPFSYLVARARGVDLRRVGSGNIGSANVWRSCGFGSFLAAVSGDILKGSAVPYLAIHRRDLPPVSVILIGAAAISGHAFPVFMGFKGGKAVATSTGVLLAIFPQGVLIGVPVWGTMLKLTRISSLSSLTATAVVLLSALVRLRQGKLDPAYAAFITLAAAAILYLHRGNIQRLREGRENRFER
jgi:glycerol-3-phosphate acyltransferase PlsY